MSISTLYNVLCGKECSMSARCRTALQVARQQQYVEADYWLMIAFYWRPRHTPLWPLWLALWLALWPYATLLFSTGLTEQWGIERNHPQWTSSLIQNIKTGLDCISICISIYICICIYINLFICIFMSNGVLQTQYFTFDNFTKYCLKNLHFTLDLISLFQRYALI